MRLTRLVMTVSIAGAVGCNLITGMADLEVVQDELEAEPPPVDSGTTVEETTPDASYDPGSFVVDAAPYDAGEEGYVDLTGTWPGIWLMDLSLIAGESKMELTQKGAELSGRLEIKGGACPRAGKITGSFVREDEIAGSFTSDDGLLVLLLQSKISADATTMNGRFLSTGKCWPGVAGATKATRSSTTPPSVQ